ncbi:MAG: hypothetical protein IIB00_10530, partial [candidate division Zixibacteria bacterium]|nr:hypothetical protein [candidate division Zixibacteria bacterium]
MSGSLSNLLSSITSQLNITPSKLFAGGLVICWKVFTDLIAVESNVLFWSVIAALLFLWGFSHKHVDEFLKKDHPTMGKRLSWICGVIILAWFGWPWPRVQGWFRADNFIVYEAKISPVGGSVSTLD